MPRVAAKKFTLPGTKKTLSAIVRARRAAQYLSTRFKSATEPVGQTREEEEPHPEEESVNVPEVPTRGRRRQTPVVMPTPPVKITALQVPISTPEVPLEMPEELSAEDHRQLIQELTEENDRLRQIASTSENIRALPEIPDRFRVARTEKVRDPHNTK